MQEKLKYYRTLADEFLNSSISLTKMAAREGTTRQTLAKHFRELGVEIINKQNRLKFDNTVFDCIDTEEKAYWLGFIFADGYISSDSLKGKSRYLLEISLKASDKNHLDKFNKFMKHENANKVTIEDAKCGKVICKRCRWYVANKHLWETLNSYGCTPRKSLTLKFPDESIFKSKDLIRHFIRGYFDGDGCFTRHIHHTIVSPAISFLGTKDFLDKILEYSKIEANYRHDKCYTEFTWTLEYHKEPGIELINYLYNNCTIYLDRKYKLYEFFKNGSRSVQEWTELLSSKIGESPIEGNTEVIEEIKESSTPYSIENEPNE
jgi:intein/homing endonuclease